MNKLDDLFKKNKVQINLFPVWIIFSQVLIEKIKWIELF